MPAGTPLAPATLYKYRTFCYSGNQVGINVRYFTANTLVSSPTELDALTAMDAALAPLYKICMPAVTQYIGSDIQNIGTTLPYEEPIFTNANQGNGSAAGNPLPAQVSGILTYTTGFAGRKYRGRSYIPFPSDTFEGASAPQIPNTTYVGNIAAIGVYTSGDVTWTVGGGISFHSQWMIFHRASLTYTPITGHRANRLWATQRRRGDYGRPNGVPVL